MKLADLVKFDYRMAAVFIKYRMKYSERSNMTLQMASIKKKIDFNRLQLELERAILPCQLTGIKPFSEWEIYFLVDYIIHMHHYYLRSDFPVTCDLLNSFIKKNKAGFENLHKVYKLCEELKQEIIPHIKEEETSIFPYIKQVSSAYVNKDSFGKLLVKTLRKPVDVIMRNEKGMVATVLEIRTLTDNYLVPENAATEYKIVLLRLKEFDYELMQHIYLENEILFPKILQIEKELLK